jgi:hypothetical protein
MMPIRNLLLAGATVLLCACIPYSYLEADGPGKQMRSHCHFADPFVNLRIDLPHGVTGYVAPYQMGSMVMVEIALQAHALQTPLSIQLTAMETPITINTLFGNKRAFSYLASISDGYVPYKEDSRQGPLADGSAVTSHVWTADNKSRAMNLHMVFAIPDGAGSHMLDFPSILINGEPVRIEPIRIERKTGPRPVCV